MTVERKILDELSEHIKVVSAMNSLATAIAEAANVVSMSLRRGGKLLLCGNGGSAADAQHIAAELTGRYLKERAPLPAMALNVNCSAVTAIGNDYGFSEVFTRDIEAFGRPGDVLMAISTSGNSPNVIHAARKAKEKSMRVIALTGQTGGDLAQWADCALCVPSASTPRIQEMHIWLGHVISGIVEEALC